RRRHTSFSRDWSSDVCSSALLPGGLAFQIPDSDPAPPARDLTSVFSPTQESHLVHLALPAFRPNGANCLLPDGAGAGGGSTGGRSEEGRAGRERRTRGHGLEG